MTSPPRPRPASHSPATNWQRLPRPQPHKGAKPIQSPNPTRSQPLRSQQGQRPGHALHCMQAHACRAAPTIQKPQPPPIPRPQPLQFIRSNAENPTLQLCPGDAGPPLPPPRSAPAWPSGRAVCPFPPRVSRLFHVEHFAPQQSAAQRASPAFACNTLHCMHLHCFAQSTLCLIGAVEHPRCHHPHPPPPPIGPVWPKIRVPTPIPPHTACAAECRCKAVQCRRMHPCRCMDVQGMGGCGGWGYGVESGAWGRMKMSCLGIGGGLLSPRWSIRVICWGVGSCYLMAVHGTVQAPRPGSVEHACSAGGACTCRWAAAQLLVSWQGLRIWGASSRLRRQ